MLEIKKAVVLVKTTLRRKMAVLVQTAIVAAVNGLDGSYLILVVK